MTNNRDIVERLDARVYEVSTFGSHEIAASDVDLMREAAALIRELDEAVESIYRHSSSSAVISGPLEAAAARHIARTKRSEK